MPRKATRKATTRAPSSDAHALLVELVQMLRAEIAGSKPMVLTIPEAADELRTSVDTIRRMIRDGSVKAHKLRGQWRIPTSEIEKIVANGRAKPAKRTSSKQANARKRTTKGAR